VHVLQNTTNYWRVAALSPNGSVGAWSATRQFSKRMSAHAVSVVGDGKTDPRTTEPTFTNISSDAASPTQLDFDRFRLEWTPVPRATFYEVTVTRQLPGGVPVKAVTCRTASSSATIVVHSNIAKQDAL